jgi:hypothetical protein
MLAPQVKPNSSVFVAHKNGQTTSTDAAAAATADSPTAPFVGQVGFGATHDETIAGS